MPLADIPPEKRFQLRLQAMKICLQKAQEYIAGRPSRKELIIREIVPGDESDATDFVDFDFKTAATTGQEQWLIDAGDLTAGDLSSVIATGEKVNDDTVIGIYGFVDLSAAAELTMVALKKGNEYKDIWEVEHCYGEPPYGGINVDENGQVMVAIWKPNDPIDIQLNVTGGSTDLPIVFLGFVVEKVGEHITVPQA